MGFEKKQINYTAEDIQKYLSGKLTPAEMHAIEKAALDDIFLAEAIEGYQELDEKERERQLKLLRSNFEKKHSSKIILMKRPASYAIWKVAAAVILICSAVVITYMITTKNPDSDNSITAINKKQGSVNDTITERSNADAITKQITPPEEITQRADQTTVKKAGKKNATDSAFLNRPAIVDKKNTNLSPDSGFLEDQSKARQELASAKAITSAQQNKLDPFETKSNKVNNPRLKDTEYATLAKAADGKTFNAQAVGLNGTPLPFANIRTSNDQPGTYADVDGNFTLKSADSILTIEIKSKGYISGNFTLRSGITSTKLVLKTNETALKEKSPDEVVVVGYGTKRKFATMPYSSISVAPVDGWDKYEIYIANNLYLTSDMLQKKIHGEVVVAFEVQSDGTLKNVNIEKSLCDDCDKAALRVIQDGPRWKVFNAEKAPGKVEVKF